LVVLCFTVGGWLTASSHGIDGAWIAIIAFAILVNTGILDWNMMHKGIDWELLIHMGVTLSIPTLLKQAKIDQWLVDVISPMILPFVDSPAWFFIVIAIMTYALKLVFTSFGGGHPLRRPAPTIGRRWHESVDNRNDCSHRLGSMVFPYQVDWHMLHSSTTDGKGFLLPADVPDEHFSMRSPTSSLLSLPFLYWRYLGLMG